MRPRTFRERYPGMIHAHCHWTVGVTPRDAPDTTFCSSCANLLPRPSGYLITLAHGFIEGQREWVHCNGCGLNLSLVQPITECVMCYDEYLNIMPIVQNEGVDLTRIAALVFCHETRNVEQLEIWADLHPDPINHTLLD